MRGEGQEPKSRAARSRSPEAAGQFYFGLLLSPAVNRNLSPASAGLFYEAGGRPILWRGITAWPTLGPAASVPPHPTAEL